jgi:ribosomal protein L11 methyltransferase
VIRLAVRVRREQADVVLAELLDLAPAGVEEVELDGGGVEYAVYGPPGELPALPDLRALAGGQAVEISTREVPDDWQERWRAFHRPVLIASPDGAPAIWVRPPWEPIRSPDERRTIELVIDPGQAFGTGGHASTRLCLGLLLEALEALEASGQTRPVLDAGTGSGVLAIAAGRLGCSPLLGLDNEQESVAAAAANAAINDVSLRTERFDLRTDPLPWLGPERTSADPSPAETLLLANLLRPLLLDLAGAIEHVPGDMIAGGLLIGELDEVARRFGELHGLRERARRAEGEWGALWLASPGTLPDS